MTNWSVEHAFVNPLRDGADLITAQMKYPVGMVSISVREFKLSSPILCRGGDSVGCL